MKNNKKVSCKICAHACDHAFDTPILKKYAAHYWHCPKCDFLFCENAAEWLAAAYKSSINIEDTGIMARNVNIANWLMPPLYKLFGNDGRYLDTAGGYGFLVRLMRDRGFDFYWNDPYTENLVARGFESAYKKYDAVTAIECFEHFADPVDELKKMRKISDCIIFSQDIRPTPIPRPGEWDYYGLSHGQHIGFYTEKTLNVMAKKIGLRYVRRDNMHFFCRPRAAKKLDELEKTLADPAAAQSFFQNMNQEITPKTQADFQKMSAQRMKAND
ncbi:MAG: class I SAM-dependent methyltransferase [Proteobacteria bacterium]|nr:class I SAM-dependent methyltransferase [Pseudomonadota bacterium]